MASKHIRTDYNVAFPTAEIAVMGSEGAVNILYGKELASASEPAAARKERVEEYEERFANPFSAARKGYIDDVIEPRTVRRRLIRALDMLGNKREPMPPKKHGNIPL
jgi:propionyl-CoA carboxylase beta chain